MPIPSARLRSLIVIPLCAALALAVGCSTTNREQKLQQRLARFTPEKLYDQGRRSLRARDYEDAVRVFEALNARYPFTPEARQGRLDVIYSYYKLGEKESAKDAAETFIRENPTHPRIDYAWYLQGLVDFERTPYRVERWMGVNLSDRPPRSARDSFNALRTVVTRFPKSQYAPDARRRMIYLRNRLADYEVSVARYYMELKAWVAAAQRARQAIEEYDGAPAMKEALRTMHRCYTELGYTELADNTAKVFEANFPGEELKPAGKKARWKFWS